MSSIAIVAESGDPPVLNIFVSDPSYVGVNSLRLKCWLDLYPT